MNSIDLRSTSDGWRGKIADTFTFDFVERVALAIGSYVLKHGGTETFVGYDTRFLGFEFAKRTCQVLSQIGLNVLISAKPIPTPLVSFSTNQKRMVCGISITASHNPYNYNGVKVRMGYGGAPSEQFVLEIHDLMNSPTKISFNAQMEFEKDDPISDYNQRLRAIIDLQSFKQHSLKICVDTMHGTTSGVLKSVLSGTKTEVLEIHSTFDPFFGGIGPEPMESSTQELQYLVSNGQCDLGIAHDGDGDRIVAVIPKLGYLSPHDVSVILLWYLAQTKNQNGIVVGSVTMSRRLSLVATYLGLEFKETPIGFKNACEIMRNEKVLIAGEENGGIGFGIYLPERDATLAGALLSEAQINFSGGINAILKEVEKVAGRSGFFRLNLKVSISPEIILEKIREGPPERIDGQNVSRISETDGLKFFFVSGDWVNLRAAGTEELLRIYAESSNKNKAFNIAKAAEEIVRKIERR